MYDTRTYSYTKNNSSSSSSGCCIYRKPRCFPPGVGSVFLSTTSTPPRGDFVFRGGGFFFRITCTKYGVRSIKCKNIPGGNLPKGQPIFRAPTLPYPGRGREFQGAKPNTKGAVQHLAKLFFSMYNFVKSRWTRSMSNSSP